MARRKTYKAKKNPNAFDLVLQQREAKRKEQEAREIEEFLAFTAEHPSVHDRMRK
jgi:hypothetical protein